MIETRWLREGEVLAIHPTGEIRKDDFSRIGSVIDPVIAASGRLEGLLVDTRDFDGWEDAGALVSHLRFAGEHQPAIARIAVVGDHWWLAAAPAMEPFFGTPIRVFRGDDEAAARAWLLESPPEPAGITILPESTGGTIAMRVQGRLRGADYDALRRELERRVADGTKLRALAIVEENFRGWTPKAALDDIAMAFSPWSRRLEKMALVSGPGFVSWFARHFPAGLLPYPFRAFDASELDQARAWLAE